MPASIMTPQFARLVLGLGPVAGPHEVRKAFREAAKLAHPDRPGGDAARFRDVIAAYDVLRAAELALPGPSPVTEDVLTITPLMAVQGGHRDVALADGRRIRITLPPGLRDGERLRAAGVTFFVSIAADGDTLVRGDDVWLTAHLTPQVLADGGRVAVETPLGRRIVWITRKAAARGLIRLDAQGLPARAGRPNGALFIRLCADERPTESRARELLKRFAEAWAA
jgi:curved DNA-binding protein